MRALSLSQWNFLWTKGNGGCTWQGVDEAEALSHIDDGRFREVVKIGDGSTVPLFGVVCVSRVDDILNGQHIEAAQMTNEMSPQAREWARIAQKNQLLSAARRDYAAEVSAEFARIASEGPSEFFPYAERNPDLEQAVAEILVSRHHAPAAWAAIDASEHAAMLEANNDDM